MYMFLRAQLSKLPELHAYTHFETDRKSKFKLLVG